MLTNPLNYLKAIIAGVGAGVIYPLVDYLVGLIPNIPQIPHTSLDIIITALLTGGAVSAAANKNQPMLQPGQVVVNQAQMVPGTVPAAVHKP